MQKTKPYRYMTAAQRSQIATMLRPMVAAQKERMELRRQRQILLDQVAEIRARERDLEPLATVKVTSVAKQLGVHLSAAYRVKRLMNLGKLA